MSIPAIAPVMARIQTIESRFGMPSTLRPAPADRTGPTDFATTLSTALGATPASTTTTTSTSAPYATPMVTTTTRSETTALDPSTPFASMFEQAGNQHGVPPELLAAVGWVESRYQTDAVSSAGAMGVMQIMPFVATELGVDPYDPPQAIDGAARLLRSHYDRFGSWDLALAAYNAGGGAVKNAGNAIPSPRVGEYVRRVNERMMST